MTASGAPARTLAWWVDGEALLGTVVGGLADADLAGPSLLPGWSRHTLVAHLARNGDALVNLLTWARTGVETPMYASPAARDAGITEAAALAPDPLRQEFGDSVHRLAAAIRTLPDSAWAAEVRTAQGRTVPGSEVPWMRCREVWVHAVDLDAGIGFTDVPADVLTALTDDVTSMWARRGQTPQVAFVATDVERRWGAGPVTARGPLSELVGWVTGRAGADRLDIDGPIPSLAAWL